MQVGQGHSRQLRHPAAHVGAGGIVIQPLLHRVVEAHGVDACGACLHLALHPVDPRLVVHESAGEHQAAIAPVNPEVITGHGHQQGAHAEVDPALGVQGPLAGIHKRQARAALAPGGQALGIGGAQSGKGGMGLAHFQLGFALELLHEMAMPMEPFLEGPGPPTAAAGMHDLPHREGAEGQMG